MIFRRSCCDSHHDSSEKAVGFSDLETIVIVIYRT